MAFNDDDLKWLKEAANHRRDKLSSIVYVDLPEIDALLARLEAAERFIAEIEDTEDFSDWSKLNPLLEAWRKACGRE